jgi:hypothetical protein
MGEGNEDKNMSESDKAWWDSVNGMLNSDPNKKHWSGWSEVGEVQQAVRENSNINEISSDLLDRAADAAGQRIDPRGVRLQSKFRDAYQDKRDQESRYANDAAMAKFDSDPNQVSLNVGGRSIRIILDGAGSSAQQGNSGTYPEWWILLGKAKQEGRGDVFECALKVYKSDFDSNLYNIRYNQDLLFRHTSDFGNSDGEKINGVDRKSAMIISNFINSKGGNIKPTQLPLV